MPKAEFLYVIAILHHLLALLIMGLLSDCILYILHIHYVSRFEYCLQV